MSPETAAVAAFLSDISGFLDDEAEDNEASTIQLTRSVSHETSTDNVTRTVSSETKGPDEERIRRNLQTGKRRDAYRKKLRDEWQSLQCQEKELEAELEKMHQRRKNDSSGMAPWRAIAMRQLEGQQMAEAQQEKLKNAVKRRRELVQDVENSLRKRLKEVEDAEENSSLTKTGRSEPSDELFEAYIEEMDTIYAKTDAVFQSCDIAPMTGPFLNTKPPKKRDGDTEYFENLGVLYVPFAFRRVCLALWETTRQPYRQLDREEYRGVKDTQNTIAVRFRVKCRLHTGGNVSLLTHFVARRYVEESRMVAVWRQLWEGEGDFEGMHSDETGWCIVQPSSHTMISPTDEAHTPSTLIRTCVRLVPMHVDLNVAGKSDFDEFTEVQVTSGKEDNLQVEQMMERMQLGEAQLNSRCPFSS